MATMNNEESAVNTEHNDGSLSNEGNKVDKCSTCNLVVLDEDKAVGCEICEKWFHIQCEELPEEIYDFMAKVEAGKQLNWTCKYCKRGNQKLYNCFKQISAVQKELNARQSALEEQTVEIKEVIVHINSANRDTESRLGSLEAKTHEKSEKLEEICKVEGEFKNEIEALIQQRIEDHLGQSQCIKKTFREVVKETIGNDNDLTAVVQTKVNEVIGQARDNPHDTRKEIRQHVNDLKLEEERRNNLIIFNLEEDKESEDALKAKDTNDFLKIAQICNAPISEENILDCRRIGKKGADKDKIRPVLIKLSSEEKKRKLFLRLNAWRKYQEENRGPVEKGTNKPFINIEHDMTQQQRTEKKSLIDKAKNLNTISPSGGPVKWVVRGPPWNMILKQITLETNQ